MKGGRIMGNEGVKKGILVPLIQGVVITYTFLVVEYVFLKLGLFEGALRLYLTDPALRFIFGGATLFFISANYKKQRSIYSLKELFTNRFSGMTYVYLLPFFLYLISDLLMIVFSNGHSFKAAGLFALNCIQQVGTGFYEEAVRVLILSGLVKYLCGTKAGRIKTVLISGALFGLSHALNFLYGQDLPSTLLQVFSCFIWGMFMAAIFIYSRNLTLLMILHAVWDIVIRIPNAFFGFPDQSAGLEVLDALGYVIQYGLMTFTAFVICLKYNSCPSNESDRGIGHEKNIEVNEKRFVSG
jgi:hypothetical protein